MRKLVSISIRPEVHQRLCQRKIVPRDAFSDIITRLLDKVEEKESTKEEAHQASLPSNQLEP